MNPLPFRLSHVGDDALLAALGQLVGRSNATTAALLAHLAEVDARGLHRLRACSSLFVYCCSVLGLPEDAAYKRIRAARVGRRFPVVFERIARGELHMTAVCLLADHLTEANVETVLMRASGKSKRRIDELVAELAPRPDVADSIRRLPNSGTPTPVTRDVTSVATASAKPATDADRAAGAPTASTALDTSDGTAGSAPDPRSTHAAPAARASTTPARIEPLAVDRYKLQFTVDAGYVRLLEQARDLLRHQLPGGDLASTHRRALELLVQRLLHRKLALTKREQRCARPASNDATSRHVRARVRRAVFARDDGRCTFVDPTGKRCAETGGLELHHRRAHALGGPSTLDNLTLRCRAHNQLAAEHDFGRAHVSAAIMARRSSQRGPADAA